MKKILTGLMILLIIPLIYSIDDKHNYLWNESCTASDCWIPWLSNSDGKARVDLNLVNLTSDYVVTTSLTVNGNITADYYSGDGSLLDGILTSANGTSGEVQFANSDGTLGANSNFVWNESNSRLGIGTSSPTTKLNIKGDGSNLRLERTTDTEAIALRFDNSAGNQVGLVQLTGSTAGNDLSLTATGDVILQQDNLKLYFGAGKDASIYYGGSNLVLAPEEVGSGKVEIKTSGSNLAKLNFNPPTGVYGSILIEDKTMMRHKDDDTWMSTLPGAGLDYKIYDASSAGENKFVQIYGRPNGSALKYGQFQITNKSSDIVFRISSDTGKIDFDDENVTFDNDILFIDSTNDKVGIGTDSPGSKLDISGTATGGDVVFNVENTDTSSFLGGFNLGFPNMGVGNVAFFTIGKENVNYNRGSITFKYVGDGDTSNYLGLGIKGHTDPLMQIRADKNILIPNDNAKLYFGAGDDASITYDGSDMVFDSQEVGTGDFVFNDGNFKIQTPEANFSFLGADASGVGELLIESKHNAHLVLDRKSSSLRSEIEYLTDGATSWFTGLADSDVLGDGSEFFIGQTEGGASPSLVIETTNDVKIPNDNAKLYFGAGNDASITYDGSNMLFNQDVGSGEFNFTSGDVIVENIHVNDKLYHRNDLDTYMDFGINNIVFKVGNTGIIDIDYNQLKINKNNADVNFIVDTQGGDNALFIDGATGNVGIGNLVPNATLEVSGEVRADSFNSTVENATIGTGTNGGNFHIDYNGSHYILWGD